MQQAQAAMFWRVRGGARASGKARAAATGGVLYKSGCTPPGRSFGGCQAALVAGGACMGRHSGQSNKCSARPVAAWAVASAATAGLGIQCVWPEAVQAGSHKTAPVCEARTQGASPATNTTTSQASSTRRGDRRKTECGKQALPKRMAALYERLG